MIGGRFRVEFLEEAVQFLEDIEQKAREKIIYNITKAQYSLDNELFKKLTLDIWEFRTVYRRTYYRLFAFWDKSNAQDSVVVVTHGLIKRTVKTPKSELERAERLKMNYEQKLPPQI
jgi:phage-related protein